MMRITLGLFLTFAIAGCGPSGEQHTAPIEGGAVLRSQADEASRVVSRISSILGRPWSSSFPSVSRLRTRLAASQAFLEEAAASAADPAAVAALVARGKEMFVSADAPVNRALAAFEMMARRLDHGAMIDEQLPAAAKTAEDLGAKGVRLRSDAWRDAWRFAQERLEAAVAATLAGNPDAGRQDAMIADGLMERALVEGERVLGEIKVGIQGARDSRYRGELVTKRLEWAKSVAEKKGAELAQSARTALADAQAWASGTLAADVEAAAMAIAEGRSNAQELVGKLAKRADDVVQALLAEFLPICRSLGMSDPP